MDQFELMRVYTHTHTARKHHNQYFICPPVFDANHATVEFCLFHVAWNLYNIQVRRLVLLY